MSKILTRKSKIRLKGYDYCQPNYYFITTCTENRTEWFGEVRNNKMLLNDVGNMINFWWDEIANHFAGIELDKCVVMPNHIHGIINIVGADRCVRPNQYIDPIKNNKIPNNYKINHNGRTHRSAHPSDARAYSI